MRYIPSGLLCAASIFAFAHGASAADMPIKAPAYQAPVAGYNWSGFYVGGNFGYGWGANSDPGVSVIDATGLGLGAFAAAGGFPITAVNPNGIIGGGQAGYNWQTNAFVFGLVADFQGADMKRDSTFVASPPGFVTGTTNVDRKLDWFGTVRGKLGWAVDNVLLYATGGLAYGHVKDSLTFSGSPTGISGAGSNSETRAGWTAGAGLAYGWGQWSVGVEYLCMDLGSSDTTMTFAGYPGAATDSVTVSNDNKVNLVRALINYRF